MSVKNIDAKILNKIPANQIHQDKNIHKHRIILGVQFNIRIYRYII